jgi:hypothetical protein
MASTRRAGGSGNRAVFAAVARCAVAAIIAGLAMPLGCSADNSAAGSGSSDGGGNDAESATASDAAGDAANATTDAAADTGTTGGGDSGSDAGNGGGGDASTDGGGDASVDGGGPDGGSSVSIPRIGVSSADGAGDVLAVLHFGTSWYIGGDFTRVSPFQAASLISISTAPATAAMPVGGACDLGTGFNGQVLAVAQTATALYVGGSFTTYKGQTANRIAMLDLPTCALDPTFDAGTGASNGFLQSNTLEVSEVRALAVNATDLYVGGTFDTYRGVAMYQLAKLNLTTGVADPAFSKHNFGASAPPPSVNAIVLTATDVYAGGNFQFYDGNTGGGNPADSIAKLNLTTALIDTNFSSGFIGEVKALALNANGLYVGGNGSHGIMKLDPATGTADTTFTPALGTQGFDGAVTSLALNGTSVYAGGTFTAYRGVANSALNIAKLDATSGAIDTTFSPPGAGLNGFDKGVLALATDATSVYVGGDFSAYRGVAGSANHFAKISLAGAQDTSFVPPGNYAQGFAGGAPGSVDPGTTTIKVAVFAGTNLWLGGRFSLYAGQPMNNLAKMDDATFAIDTTFSPPANNGFDGGVQALAGFGNAVYVGGYFGAYRGGGFGTVARIAKLDTTTGAIDTTFSPVGAGFNGFNGPVFGLAVNATDVYVAGSFTAYRSIANSANNIAKLDRSTGVLDTTFSPNGATANGFDNRVDAIAINATDVYVGGFFKSYRGVASSANYVAKLNLTTGAIDTTFSPPGATTNGFDGNVYAIAINATDVYVGGQFGSYKGALLNAKHIAKLNLTTGVIDTTFSPLGMNANGFDLPVNALALTATSVYAGGSFTSYRGASISPNIAKLGLANGVLDPAFAAPAGKALDNVVDALGVGACAGCAPILVTGGGFSQNQGELARGLTAMDPTTAALAP